MKRIISVLIVLMLCACSGSKISWDDVKDKYSGIRQSVSGFAENASNFLKGDYSTLISQLEENIEKLTKGIGEEGSQIADTVYETAAKLEQVASLFTNDNAAQLKKIAQDTMALVEAAYNRSDDFDSIKKQLQEELTAVKEWSDEAWSSVEKKETIKWSSVEESYAQFEEEIIDNLQSRRKVTEIELEELKNIIVNNYDIIAKGVTEDNDEIAREIYAAGLQLSEYTKGIDGDAPEKVYRFGIQTMQYVIECFGGPVTLEDYDFTRQVSDAAKWSLSLWNELTALLKKY